jgi:hypothetical protein
MPRRADWERDATEALRLEQWSVTPPNRLIKVVQNSGDIAKKVAGYVTLERWILGRTPRQLEADLGLPTGHFANGCRIYAVTRLPGLTEIEYELTVEFPRGLAFDENEARNKSILRHNNPALPAEATAIYGPGRKSIHQWNLKVAMSADLSASLLPNESYSYPHSRQKRGKGS